MIIYRTVSAFQVLIFFCLKVGYLIGASIAVYYYQENPIVTIIVASICLLFFILTGTDEIIVYEHIMEYRSANILRAFRQRKQFNIKDIKSIQVEGNYDIGSELHGVSNPKNSSYNNLQILFKDGSIVNLTTTIYIEKLKKAVFEISSRVNLP